MSAIDSYTSGGVAAARAAELAASLAAAAADHSRERWPEAGGARAQAQALERRAVQLGEHGAEAYAAAREALAHRGHGAGSGDQAKRDWQLGVAVEQAAEAPLGLAAIGADIAELAREIALRADDQVRDDAVVAAMLAAAAARAGARLVQINLAVGQQQPAMLAQRYAEAAAAAVASAEAEL